MEYIAEWKMKWKIECVEVDSHLREAFHEGISETF